MKYINFSLSIFVLIILSVSSCIDKPTFSTTPEIEFESVQRVGFLRTQGITMPTVVDSLYITIKFRDGDGDLGLNRADTLPPYASFNEDGSLNRYRNNYFIETFRKESGEFVPYILPDAESITYRFPYMNEESTEGGPLEGSLTFVQAIDPSSYVQFNPSPNTINRFDTLRFRINIADRALNESNVIETNEVVVNQNE